jgi:hypothetical protein
MNYNFHPIFGDNLHMNKINNRNLFRNHILRIMEYAKEKQTYTENINNK